MKEDIEHLAVAKLREFVELRDRDVLEVGCGDGRITARLQGIPRRLVGIDPDHDSIREAKTCAPGACFEVGAGERLDFSDASFDVILYTLSLHHQNAEKALREANRVLKTNGRVLVLEPVAGSEIEQLCRPFCNEADDLLDALYAVLTSRFVIEKREIFDVVWRFDNRHELHEWAFDYYETPFDPDIAAKMDRHLGDKITDAPLLIQDRLLLVSLKR